jgi:hypothetical protein
MAVGESTGMTLSKTRTSRATRGARNACPPAPEASGGDRPPSTGLAYAKLFVLSAFLLFLEMALIRWISTEIRVFAYFGNLTLIGCFLGIGAGCLFSDRPQPTFAWSLPLVAGLCLAVMLPKDLGHDIYRPITAFLGDFNEMPLWMWGSTHGMPILPRLGALLLLAALFCVIVGLFIPGGRLMGILFQECPQRLRAYSVNIAGSLAGVWLFSLLSALMLPPPTWFGVACLLALPLLASWRQRGVALVCLAALVAPFLYNPLPESTTIWSPYQRLRCRPFYASNPGGPSVAVGYQLDVNDTFYQRIQNLSPSFLQQYADIWPEARDTAYLGYNLIYRILAPSPANVLIVGAGTGNDVAAALRNGAGHVDAVEIDPAIVAIGRWVHPERPYDDPRVSVFVDDARSFLKKTTRRYDLIWFGALDSHTLASSFSNVRIDNYVYTVESFREARELLADDGLLAVVFAAEKPFIGVRLSNMLEAAFGSRPCTFFAPEIPKFGGGGGGPTFLAARDGRLEARLAADERVHRIVEASAIQYKGNVPLGTDDWPYLYLESRTVPRLYIIVMGILVVGALLAARRFVGDVRTMDWPFFAMGAAFLLVEVQSVSKMAMLFGSTWVVNAIVVSCVMVTILLANAYVAWRPARSLWPFYLGLLLALAVNLVFPFRALLVLPGMLKGVCAGGIMALPVLFSGVIFASVFSRAREPSKALGANILGAIAGGACEALSFIIGINALGLIAIGFYLWSLVAFRRRGHLALAA